MRSRGEYWVPMLCLLLAGCRGIAQEAEPVAGPTDQAGSAVIYVDRRGWHTDIGFAAGDLTPPLRSLTADFPGVRYLFFGFGDSHYLMAKKQNFPVMLAALWPGAGIVLATGLAAAPDKAFGGNYVLPLSVTPEQARAAQAFVWKSLVRQGTGTGVYAVGPYQGSLYYASNERYSAVHTCNTWTAEALKSAGLPVRTAGVVFAGQLWSQARHLPKAPAAAQTLQVPAALPLRSPAESAAPAAEAAAPR